MGAESQRVDVWIVGTTVPPESAAIGIAETFGITEAAALNLLSLAPRAVRRGLSRADGRVTEVALTDAGAVCVMVPEGGQPGDALPDSIPPATEAKTSASEPSAPDAPDAPPSPAPTPDTAAAGGWSVGAIELDLASAPTPDPVHGYVHASQLDNRALDQLDESEITGAAALELDLDAAPRHSLAHDPGSSMEIGEPAMGAAPAPLLPPIDMEDDLDLGPLVAPTADGMATVPSEADPHAAPLPVPDTLDLEPELAPLPPRRSTPRVTAPPAQPEPTPTSGPEASPLVSAAVAAGSGVLILLVSAALGKSIFQGDQGLISVWIDSQAIFLFFVAAIKGVEHWTSVE